MSDAQLLRYSRQINLPQVDIKGQEKLRESKVLLIGLGGLGSPVAMYLCSAGIGQLTISDHDDVDLSNLQRQLLHTTPDIGRPKTRSAKATLNAINPEVDLILLQEQLSGEKLDNHIRAADVVVDASDNFATRFLLNQACVNNKRPLVSAAAIRFEGQLSVFCNDQPHSPCYRCLYKDERELGERCSETGILAPVVGVMGCLQATETLKLLMGIGDLLVGRLLILDALRMEFRTIKLKKDPVCPVCSQSYCI